MGLEKNVFFYFAFLFFSKKKYNSVKINKIFCSLDCPLQVFLLSVLTCQADYHRKRLMAEAGCNNNRFV